MTRRFYLSFALLLTLVASTTTLAKDDFPIVRLDTSAGIIDIKLFPRESAQDGGEFPRLMSMRDFTMTRSFIALSIILWFREGGSRQASWRKKPKLLSQMKVSTSCITYAGQWRWREPMTPILRQRNSLSTSAVICDWIGPPGSRDTPSSVEVIRGMGVIDFIATAETGTQNFETAAGVRPFRDVPIESVVIKTATRHKAAL